MEVIDTLGYLLHSIFKYLAVMVIIIVRGKGVV